MELEFDVVVIGAGPGGYVGAIQAAQLGLRVACVDAYSTTDGVYSLGGTCLNVGCIPSKALLQSSENFFALTNHFHDHGISCANPSIDIATMMARKGAIVKKNADGIKFLFKKNKVTELHGVASFIKRDEVNNQWYLEVNDRGTSSVLKTLHVIIASGSKVRQLPQVAIDNNLILDNVGALSLQETPQTLGIIGAGVIGVEMGSVWRRLGSKVTIFDSSKDFLAQADSEVARTLQTSLGKDGITINTGVEIVDIKIINDEIIGDDLVTLSKNDNKRSNNQQQHKQSNSFKQHQGGKKVVVIYRDNSATVDDPTKNNSPKETNSLTKDKLVEFTCDKLIVAIGRTANTNCLNKEAVGLACDERGFIVVNDACQTNLTNVWAVGDCVRGPMLAHKASAEAKCVVERIAGKWAELNFNHIPWVIYTNPEVAWVGKTEAQLIADSIQYNKGVARFMANGRALALGDSVGFVKILSAVDTDRILGVHMVGPFVSELITEAVVAMEFMASSEDLARIIHAHPSLTEVTQEAAMACSGIALHG